MRFSALKHRFCNVFEMCLLKCVIHRLTMLCNRKRYCTGKPRYHNGFGVFCAPIFKCKQKDIILCPEDLNYRPLDFRRLLRDVFSRKPPFFVSTEKVFSKRSSLHFRDDLPYRINSIFFNSGAQVKREHSALFRSPAYHV